MKKTIIHLIDYGGAYSGNFITSLISLEEESRRKNSRLVFVFTDIAKDREWMEELKRRGIPIYFVSKKMSIWNKIHEINKIIEKENGEIIHTHFSSFDILSTFLSYKLRIKGKRVSIVWHIHSDFAAKRTLLKRIKKIIRFRILGSGVNIISVSDHLKQELVDIGIPAKNVHTILNGIDINRATKIMKGRTDVRNDLQINQDSIVFLSFGWHPQVKGIDILLSAMKSLNKTENNIILIIVGEQKLRDFIDNTYNSIPKWLKIISPTENISDIYNAVDVFISASRGEGFSYSVGEAMVNRLPIISSDIPGLSWAKSAKGVFFFENNNHELLLNELNKVIELSREQRITIGEPNYDFIIKKVSLKKWVENTMEFYERLS